MAIHSSILAWVIPRTEEPGGLQSMALQRVGHRPSTVYIFKAKLIPLFNKLFCFLCTFFLVRLLTHIGLSLLAP